MISQFMRPWLLFRQQTRAVGAVVFLLSCVTLAAFAELWISHRALIVHYDGQTYFPSYGTMIPGEVFGQPQKYETNYQDLQHELRNSGADWVVMPVIPHGPLQSDLSSADFPPRGPSMSDRHLLGTDAAGRDVLARVVYGFRTAMLFSAVLLLGNYCIGLIIGSSMAMLAGRFDFVMQRVLEVMSNLPLFYVVLIVVALMSPSFWTLLLTMMIFGWMHVARYVRTTLYSEVARDYVLAARALGASRWHILFRHLLPHSMTLLVTLMPFSLAAGISSLTALDYLGYGLPPPAASLGELLDQGISNMEQPWIVTSVLTVLISTLLAIAFVGEALRDALDTRAPRERF